MSGTDVGLDSGWAQARWVKILDRIEHRQLDVGLRFWGPPLWLEVTMTGPDSDLWPTISERATAWDWQSSAPCIEVAALTNAGADDARLLAVVSRYTIENLILNAVHEVGEWFRFDGQRLFPAHGSSAGALPDRDEQGNGTVTLRLQFGHEAHLARAVSARPAPGEHAGRDLVRRLAEAASASRFTYLPGTTISYETAGPVIRRWSDREPTSAWRSTWSSSTLEAAAADDAEVVALVARDVHRALVSHETDRICRAFHVDGTRPWTFGVPEAALGADPPDTHAHDAELLSISIDYADTSSAIDGRVDNDHTGAGPAAGWPRALAPH
jgi:hypothetical protein